MRADTTSTPNSWFRTYGFAAGAIFICLLLGLAMIANNQLGGESMWFYYTTVFHHGVKLYADLHLPLQPLFILENDVWMRLLGSSNIAMELPSVLHVLLLAVACFLVANESPWSAFEKAVMTMAGFMVIAYGHSYRFDDYHVLSESLIMLSIWMVLVIARTEADRARLLRVAVLGIFTGLAFTTRNTDGAALGVSASFALLFLLPRRRIVTIALYTAVTVAVILFIVHLTGDSFAVYLSKTLFRAAKSKGGTGSIAHAPVSMFLNAFPLLRHTVKRVVAGLLLMAVSSWAIARYLPRLRAFLIPLQILVFLFLVTWFGIPLHNPLGVATLYLLNGMPMDASMLVAGVLLYFLAPAAVIQCVYHRWRRDPWNCREVLLVIPLAQWFSYSASSAGQPLLEYYAPIAEALLLIAVIAPFRRSDSWARPSYIAWMLVLCATTITSKAMVPYSWQNYRYPPMFEGRVWYEHPVRGKMYIERDLLAFSTRVCKDIGETGFDQRRLPSPRPELLSLPYAYPNYFCDAPPWHNYVQTWFDISTQETIDQLMQQLDTAPPQWIVYQRQLNIMDGVERLYNHNQPIPHRALDHFIMAKIQSGQWQVVDTSGYLARGNDSIDKTRDPTGEDWFIIRTHP